MFSMFYMPTFSIHLSKVKSLQTMHVKFFENSINNKIQLKGYLIIQIFKCFVNANIVHSLLSNAHSYFIFSFEISNEVKDFKNIFRGPTPYPLGWIAHAYDKIKSNWPKKKSVK